MGLKDVMAYLQKRAADTPDTSKKIREYQRKASVYAGCTPDTPDTLHIGDTQENAQFGPFGKAVNDPPTAKPPASPAKQMFGQWVEAWRPLADAYHQHHFACPTCIAAGKGYGLRCGAGAALNRAYEDMP